MTLHLGDKGSEVGTMQQLLVEAGETVYTGELTQALFGPSTLAAVLDFQASHIDAHGHPLTQDGVVGPITLTALQDPKSPTNQYVAPGWYGDPSSAPNDKAKRAAVTAIGEIGTCEVPSGSNRGPRVDLYEGKDWLGSPWCALFCSWAWAHADEGSPFGVQASALKLRDWGLANSKLLSENDLLLPGDVGIILRTGGRGHVELVVAPEVDGETIKLVGGNVSNAVRGTVRPRSQFTSFIRPV